MIKLLIRIGPGVRVDCDCFASRAGVDVDRADKHKVEKGVVTAAVKLVLSMLSVFTIPEKKEMTEILLTFLEMKLEILEIQLGGSIVFRLDCPDLDALKNLARIYREGFLRRSFDKADALVTSAQVQMGFCRV